MKRKEENKRNYKKERTNKRINQIKSNNVIN